MRTKQNWVDSDVCVHLRLLGRPVRPSFTYARARHLLDSCMHISSDGRALHMGAALWYFRRPSTTDPRVYTYEHSLLQQLSLRAPLNRICCLLCILLL